MNTHLRKALEILISERGEPATTDREVLDKINNSLASYLESDNILNEYPELDNSNVCIPNGFASSYIGLYFDKELEDYRAIYSKQEMVRALMTEDKMSKQEAIEFLSHNTWFTTPPGGNPVLYIDVV